MNNFNEPSVDDTISILRESKEQYRVHYEVKINDSALVAAAILADRYTNDGSLPDNALDFLDRAAAKLQGKLRSKLLAPTSNDRISLERELAKLAERRNTIDLEINQAERNYDLGLVAELRYGKLPQIERIIEIEQGKLDRLNSVDLSGCDEEIAERDVVEIVAELTENSIDRILASGILKQSAEDRENTARTNRLLRDRIIFLGTEIDDEIANTIVAQLLFLEAEDSEKDIYLYINSPGGSVSAGMAILDTIEYIRPDVCTVCMGFAAGMGGLLLSAGAKGKRMSLPSGRMMIMKPLGGAQGQATDIAIQAKEILYIRTKINNLLAQYTGQPPGKIDRDTDRDFYLNAIEAKEYGLIDTIVDRV